MYIFHKPTLKIVSTTLSNSTHVGIPAPPHLTLFFDDRKIVRLAEWVRLVRVFDLKPHVYKGFDLYMLYTHTKNKGNATQCRRSCKNRRITTIFNK